MNCGSFSASKTVPPFVFRRLLPFAEHARNERLVDGHSSAYASVIPTGPAQLNGQSCDRSPPGGTVRGKGARWIDIHEGDQLDEAQMANWLKQAAALPGWVP